jgi:hypothetical protein
MESKVAHPCVRRLTIKSVGKPHKLLNHKFLIIYPWSSPMSIAAWHVLRANTTVSQQMNLMEDMLSLAPSDNILYQCFHSARNNQLYSFIQKKTSHAAERTNVLTFLE